MLENVADSEFHAVLVTLRRSEGSGVSDTLRPLGFIGQL